MALTQVSQAMGGTGTSSVAGSLTNTFGFKNRIINGDMRIDQRNAGALVSGASGGAYVLDRWRFWANATGAAYTVQQSTISPAGFTNSLAITQTASQSPTGSDYSIFAQYIEGYNVSDFGWGSAAATTVTLSFWVRSSLTGTFGGAVSNLSQTRSYPFTYTISAANTWEYKTITIPGDITGTWIKNTGAGILLFWQLGVGSTYLGTATGAWQAATYLGVTGATQITATNGTTLYITGVQLEVGSQATSFDYRDYGRELILCQRYYETFYGTAGAYLITVFQAISGSNVNGGGTFKVTKRASASIALIGNVYINGYNNGGLGAGSIAASASSVDSWGTMLTGVSGLTAGNASGIYPANASSGFAFSAEL